MNERGKKKEVGTGLREKGNEFVQGEDNQDWEEQAK